MRFTSNMTSVAKHFKALTVLFYATSMTPVENHSSICIMAETSPPRLSLTRPLVLPLSPPSENLGGVSRVFSNKLCQTSLVVPFQQGNGSQYVVMYQINKLTERMRQHT